MNSLLNTDIKPRYPLYVDLAEVERHQDYHKLHDYDTNGFYEQQQRMLEATPLGDPLPKEVRIGKLPYVGTK